MEQEHERAAGAWHSEWPTLTELLTTVGLGRRLARREPDRRCGPTPRAWPPTVAAARDPELAGALAEALTPILGRGAAHDAAADAVRRGRPRPAGRWREVLAGRDRRRRRTLLGGAADVGEAGAQVDAVLADHARLTEGTA